MKINRKTVAQKVIDYLYHRIQLTELIDWAERAMMDADFEEQDFEILRDIVSHLGLADVKAFGISWGDCEDYLSRLGYHITITVSETASMT